MPDIDDKDLALESSASTETLDEATASAPADQSDSADSSVAQGENSQDLDTLSIVRDVVKDERGEGEEAASPADSEEGGSEPSEQKTTQEVDDENYSDVPFHKHPRFQHLLREKKAYQADAQRYRNVQAFLDAQGLSAEETAEGLVIMGLMKTDPVEAWNRLKPTVQKLLQAAGEVLPDDIQQRVLAGEMSREAAFELSRQRAQYQALQAGMSFREQQARQQQQIAAQQALVNTAIEWEADRRAKDPNFEQKYVPLQKELAYIQSREGIPSTPEGVRDQLKRAYDAVILPAPATPPMQRTQTPVRTGMSGQVSGNAQPKPQSTLDIIRQARAARGS